MAIRLYIKPKTRAHDVAAAYLRRHGILPELMIDDRDWTYFDVTPPVRWSKNRQEEFRAGLDRLDWC